MKYQGNRKDKINELKEKEEIWTRKKVNREINQNYYVF